MSRRRFYLVGNGALPRVKKAVREITRRIKRFGDVVGTDVNLEADLSRIKADAILVFGGDGSMLRAAWRLKENPIPMLGVNFGRLGFLTTIPDVSVEKELEELLTSDWKVVERMRVQVEVRRSRKVRRRFLALNEAILARNNVRQMIDVEVAIDKHPLAVFSGDGLIVATPVGSTGHSLSAGGPVLHPDLEAMVFTPICAHTLSIRPAVLPGYENIQMHLTRKDRDAVLTIDGQQQIKINSQDQIDIRRSANPLKLIVRSDFNYYDLLKDKFHWGARPTHDRERV